ncbi:transcriptional corepressor hairless [Haematobia irritans]|uniref:transcriptional corepressor hairless n=1 Tax=Haematobia irritans TaxID=7368 RepID=UPI003F4F7DC9
MKILQNETSNATTPNDSITEKEKLQHLPIVVEQKRKAKTLKNKILQNVAEQQQQQQEQDAIRQQQERQQQANVATSPEASIIAMTDETSATTTTTTTNTTTTTVPSAVQTTNSNSSRTTTNVLGSKDLAYAANCNNNKSPQNNNNNNNTSNSELIIAEAAKILLKNGLNGTNAAAAAAVATATATLLTAAANFQIPQQHHISTPQQQLTSTSSSSSALSTSSPLSTSNSSNSSSSTKTALAESTTLSANAKTAAAAAHAQLVAIAAAAVNATNHKRLANTLTALNNSASSAFNNNNSATFSQHQQLNNGSLVDGSSTPPHNQSTGLSSKTASTPFSTPQFAKPFKSAKNNSGGGMATSSIESGVIDYTINSSSNQTSSNSTSGVNSPTSSPVINLSVSAHNTNSQSKIVNSSNSSIHCTHLTRTDIGRPPISSTSTNNHNHNNAIGGGGGFGGRLQFFKDGKFILELARSKDGDKSGWVSVPRKVFRTPSAATSSTVTPSATASTSGGIIPSPLTTSSPAAIISAGSGGVGVSYPKNECSNSLSFSDDNSSLQSSPWQRDHCWKQAAPRKNVSKEMALFYHKPACRKFSSSARLLALRKRRKPYDIKSLENGSQLFMLYIKNKEQKQPHNLKFDIDVKTKTSDDIDIVEKTPDTCAEIKEQPKIGQDIKCEIVEKSKGGSTTSKEEFNHDKEAINRLSAKECDDVEMTRADSPIRNENGEKETKTPIDPNVDEVQKMNTSDCDGTMEISKKSESLNGNAPNEDSQINVPGTSSVTRTENECDKQGDEEKRLKKPENIKTRAKLTTIVQKLMDASASRLAATPHLFKNSTQNSLTTSTPFTPSSTTSTSSTLTPATSVVGGKNSKVSPPSNSAASRLVEYHQQHVSPRKRILREFEKVSLEDNATAAGGKRSRAKGNHSTTTSTANSNVSHTKPPHISPMSKSASSTNVFSTQSNNQTTKSTAGLATTSQPQTKLYSSYSIHSLLGGGSSSSNPPVSSSSASNRKGSDLPATITSNSMGYNSYQSSSIHNSANQSPTSPEGNAQCGGKSPSNSASKLKRSPPYSSPMREAHSRSPTTNSGINTGVGYDYGRRSPRPMPEVYNKIKYAGMNENTGSPQPHYNQSPQTFYSPYMTSPHYIPPPTMTSALSPSTSSSGATSSTSSTATNSSRSPRHHSSAFRATTPTSSTNMSGSTSNHNIPSTQRGDFSPQRSTTASPRETTPRTVPKKTASIRRQFASPTSANTTTNNSNCTSPTMESHRNEDSERRTPVSHQQLLLHRASPGNANVQSSPLHPYSYMYGAGTSSPHHPTSAISPTTSNPSSAAAVAAAAASYIPGVVGSPYYHPYISTLAAMRHPQVWMQHYQSAAAANPALLQASRHPAMLSAAAVGAAAAAARLSPPYHGYQYNGVGNAAALAAAAAAAGFGSASAATPPHHHSSSTLPPLPPGSMFNAMVHGMTSSHPAVMHTSAGLVPASATVSAALGSAQPMTDTTDLSKASKNNYSSSSPLPGNSAVSAPTATTANSMYQTSNKDEQSSDVPLNLSKH